MIERWWVIRFVCNGGKHRHKQRGMVGVNFKCHATAAAIFSALQQWPWVWFGTYHYANGLLGLLCTVTVKQLTFNHFIHELREGFFVHKCGLSMDDVKRYRNQSKVYL